MNKILIITSGSGSLLDLCFKFSFFKISTDAIISDRECLAIEVAKKNNIDSFILDEKENEAWSDKVLKIAVDRNIKYILSYSNLKILKGKLLIEFKNRIFNSHFSLLPSFKGYYNKIEPSEKLKATQIFERTLEHKSLITGNTIHILESKIDNGAPLIVGLMNIPYEFDFASLRHELFIIECKTILQLTDWISQDRLYIEDDRVKIKDVTFDSVGFSPNLENVEIINFKITKRD
jgi:phosphoribosylglycinamide formyltransferase-1